MVRLLAYSSIGQAGYMLVPLGIAATAHGRTDKLLTEAVAATVAYIAIYAVLNLGLFGCVIAVARRTPRNLIADYRGLARTSPVLAGAIAFFMLGLAGVPPAIAGLVAKFYVFRTAIDGKMGWLAAVMAVNTVVAAWYYLRIAFTVFAGVGEPAGEAPLGRPHVPVALVTAIAIALVAAVAIGFYPDLVFRYGPALALH
jgi:NADH-quinone oxidoreductase subunit N